MTITLSLPPNLIVNAALKADHALEAAEKRKCGVHESNCSERGLLFVPRAIEVLGGFSLIFKKTLNRIKVIADNRCFISHGL